MLMQAREKVKWILKKIPGPIWINLTSLSSTLTSLSYQAYGNYFSDHVLFQLGREGGGIVRKEGT